MANSSTIYWVKLERSLFRKPEWSVTMNNLKIGLHKDREEALTATLAEAERTSILGRASEVWIDEGMGFMLHKAFKATKPDVKEDDDEDGPGDDLDLDETAYL
jgi:hypothetical protein